MKKIQKHAVLAVVVVVMLVVMGSLAFAGPSSQDIQKVKSQGGYSALLAKIAERGDVRVIVGLRHDFIPMASPKTAAAQVQIAKINSVQDALMNEMAGYNVRQSYKYKYTPYVFMIVDEAALNVLLASYNVADIHEDIAVPPLLAQSVPLIGAPYVWNSGYTGKGITVAVLDTGVDKTHPFLSGSVISEACYSTNDSASLSSSVCPGGVTEATSSGSAMPYAGGCPTGQCDHGTHVAGIIAGRQNVVSSPGPGVAPDVNLIAIQVFSAATCGSASCVLTYSADQMKALERVYALRATYNIAAVNMSLGGGYNSSNCDADPRKPIIDTLKATGTATIIATGNDGYVDGISSPACISSAVSVGATTKADDVADYSNSASIVTLFAPGGWCPDPPAICPSSVGIVSSVPNGYNAFSGTSMAAPHVAGAWALMKQASYSSSVDDILYAFTSTGQTITDYQSNPLVTKQRIDVNEALNFIGIPLNEAVDNLNLSVKTFGNVQWTGQNAFSYYGGDAAQSGVIGDGENSWLETTITGPAQVSFMWQVSSELNYDFLRFYIDAVEQSKISGETVWTKKTYSVGAGPHTLRWKYGKDALNSAGYDAGWVDKFTVTYTDTVPPVLGSISPTPMTTLYGVAQQFTSVYSEAGGYAKLMTVELLINSTASGTNAIRLKYDQTTNRLYLYNNTGTGALQPGCIPGTPGMISNTQGSLNCQTTKVKKLGNEVAVTWDLTPNASFASTTPKKLLMQATDMSGNVRTWTQKGTWTILPANSTPSVGSVTPSSLISVVGAPETFTAVYTDPNGYSNLKNVEIQIGTTADGSNSIKARYTFATNTLNLLDNAGTSYVATSCRPGSSVQISNSQGTLNCIFTTVSVSGKKMTVNWNVTPKPSIDSTLRDIRLRATDNSLTSAVAIKGSWTVLNAPPPGPALSPDAEF